MTARWDNGHPKGQWIGPVREKIEYSLDSCNRTRFWCYASWRRER